VNTSSRTTQAAFDLLVTPIGALRLTEVSSEDARFLDLKQLPAEAIESFRKSSSVGLTFLASDKCDVALPATWVFWRRFAEHYFCALCRQRLPRQGEWVRPEAPDDATLQDWIRAAPPMKGLEYLSVAGLRRLWAELDEATRVASQQWEERENGVAGYLRSLRRQWNVIGRVTFHLAENKKNPDRPFAFMATFTPEETAGPQAVSVKHAPLAHALHDAVESRDRQQLDRLLEPVSRAAKQSSLVAELLESRQLFSPQAWGIQQAYRFLSAVPAMEESGIIVRVPDWWNASRPPRPTVDVRIGSKSPSTLTDGGLDLQVGVSIDGHPLTDEELQQLAQAREGLTFLKGKWVQVDQSKLQSALQQWNALRDQHVKGIDFLKGMRLLSGASIHGDDADEEAVKWSRVQPGEWLEKTLATLRHPDGTIKLSAEKQLKATLRPYQADGARWLWFLYQLGMGGCLADDMGLGKTIQVISLLLQLKQASSAAKKNKPPALLVLPTSLLGNWQREIERFAPSLRLLVYHRSAIDADTMNQIASEPSSQLAGVDVLAITYGLVRRATWLADVRWRLIVLDEAQAIKNASSAQAKSIKKIPSDGRLALTGTPVENHLGDLWSLFDFCSPGLLGTPAQFKKFVKADDPQTLSARLASLRTLIQPYVLRRMKTDPKIISDLPEKTEMRVDCGLTQTQATLYQAITDELAQSLDTATGIQRRGMVLAALMQLKQICNHPSLYLKQSDFAARDSAKYSELQRICEVLLDKQERMLLFTQFQSMCDPLARFLSDVFGRDGLVLTGKTPAKRRKSLVDQFQDPEGPPFFVISVKAGGTGLNLTEASHVVHFDRWWNPAVEDQATDRAFRIGQKRNVVVHKFVCRGTLEERIDDMIRGKKEISNSLFDDSGEVNLTELSDEELMRFVSLDVTKASVD
jgi:non-specific serine/threonine protein kinase